MFRKTVKEFFTMAISWHAPGDRHHPSGIAFLGKLRDIFGGVETGLIAGAGWSKSHASKRRWFSFKVDCRNGFWERWGGRLSITHIFNRLVIFARRKRGLSGGYYDFPLGTPFAL